MEAELKMKQMELAEKQASPQKEYTTMDSHQLATLVPSQEDWRQRFMEQNFQLRQLRAQNAEHTALIRGLQFSLSTLDQNRILGDLRAVAAYTTFPRHSRPFTTIQNHPYQLSSLGYFNFPPSTAYRPHPQPWAHDHVPALVGSQDDLPQISQSWVNTHQTSTSASGAIPLMGWPMSK